VPMGSLALAGLLIGFPVIATFDRPRVPPGADRQHLSVHPAHSTFNARACDRHATGS
jgi:hypothetical protein